MPSTLMVFIFSFLFSYALISELIEPIISPPLFVACLLLGLTNPASPQLNPKHAPYYVTSNQGTGGSIRQQALGLESDGLESQMVELMNAAGVGVCGQLPPFPHTSFLLHGLDGRITGPTGSD